MRRRLHNATRTILVAWAGLTLGLCAPGPSRAELSTSAVQRIDRIHDWTFMKLNSTANHFDEIVGGVDMFQRSDTNSEFRLKLFTEVKTGSVKDFSVEPDYSVSLNLPRIERRFHLFVNKFAPDSIPGESPLEQKRTTFLGVKQSVDLVRKFGLETAAGIKWRLPPVFFGQVQLSHRVEKSRCLMPTNTAISVPINGRYSYIGTCRNAKKYQGCEPRFTPCWLNQ